MSKEYCFYLLADGTCGVTMPRRKADCPCEDYQIEPDNFWVWAGHDERMGE